MTAVTTPIAAHAARRPDGPALIFEDTALSWRKLSAAIERLASRIAALTPSGGGVALHLPNSLSLALLFLAAARAGRESVVLDPDWPIETTRGILAKLAPSLCVTADRRIPETALTLFLPASSALPDIETALQAQGEALSVPEPDPDLPFYVGFTSGSTGTPKGYRRSHRSWVESFRGDAREFGIGPQDVVLAPGTLTHSLFLYAMVNGLYAGATVVLCRRFAPRAAWRLLHAHDATVFYGVPTHLQLLVDAGGRDGTPGAPSVRWVLASGAKWFDRSGGQLRRCFPNARFAEFYGASELSFVTVAKEGESAPPDSVGRAFPGVVITIRDRRGRRLPRGRTGLVFVESQMLFSGYAIGEEKDIYRAGRAVSVGDLGFLDANGFLHLVGRAGRMLVTSGKNVFPEEIERVLKGHPDLLEAAVFGTPDVKRGQRLAAVVCPRNGERLSRAALIAHARAALPLYKVPRLYCIANEWPRTRSGKTDFAALQRHWREGRLEALA